LRILQCLIKLGAHFATILKHYDQSTFVGCNYGVHVAGGSGSGSKEHFRLRLFLRKNDKFSGRSSRVKGFFLGSSTSSLG
jgi:hypothetical protein